MRAFEKIEKEEGMKPSKDGEARANLGRDFNGLKRNKTTSCENVSYRGFVTCNHSNNPNSSTFRTLLLLCNKGNPPTEYFDAR